MNKRAHAVLLLHALAGWILCAAAMGIGMATTSLNTTLIIHAIGAPVFFAVISFVYFSRFNDASPFATAAYFLSFVILVDFFIVALLINRSLEMFTSLLGTWIPFSLIFLSTYVTGNLVLKSKA